MADDVDIANDALENELSRAIVRLRQQNQVGMGTKICVECGEAIHDERRKLGFKLCISCATESERRRSLYTGID